MAVNHSSGGAPAREDQSRIDHIVRAVVVLACAAIEVGAPALADAAVSIGDRLLGRVGAA